MRVLRLIARALLCLLALPFLLALVAVGFFARPRHEDEAQDDAPQAIERRAEDDEIEDADDDLIRRWLADLSPDKRARRLRQAYSRQNFKPVLRFRPWWQRGA